MSSYQLAQLNIARLVAPIDSPVLADFVANLDRINALADRSLGFVWRFQTKDGDASAIRHFGGDMLVSMSVWENVKALNYYVYESALVEIMRRRKEWFELMDEVYLVLWPIPHPPVFNDEESAEARRNYVGSGLAKQAIVNALTQGPEEDYAKGEAVAARMFRPILRSHRATLEQMAMLEPAMSKTVAATCITVLREGMDEAIRRGVPAQAAKDFMMGHINVELAIVFDEIDWEFSDGAKKAIELAKRDLFQPDWKKVFERQHLQESVAKIVGKA